MANSLAIGTGLGAAKSSIPAWALGGSVLDLDFANERGFNALYPNKSTNDSILTYTSPSPKMVYGDDGVLRYAPHNLLQNSNFAGSLVGDDFTATNWGLINSTGTATAQTSASSPLDNAVRFQVSSTREAYGQNVAMVTGNRYRFSFDLEAMPVSTAWNQIFNVVTISYTIETYNGETTVGNNTPIAVGGRVYIDFVVTSGGTGGIRFGCGVSGNSTGDVTLSRPMLTKLPISGFDYLRNTSTTAAVYSLPIDHAPVTHEALGVLIEEQRTNLLTYSGQFDNAAWTKSSSTVTANAATAPDGTTTADKLIPGAASGDGRASQSFTGAIGTTYTLTVYGKQAEFSNCRLYSDDGVSNTVSVSYNLSTGAVSTAVAVGGGNWTAASSTITSVGNGWYRMSLTWTATAVAPTRAVYWCRDTGDGTSGIYLWGAQIEAGAFPTSYIPTVASQVTRAADQVSILTSAFAFNVAAGSLLTQATPPQVDTSLYVSSLDNGGGNELIATRAISSRWRLLIVDDVVTVVNIDAGSAQANISSKIAIAWELNNAAVSRNGSAVIEDTSVTVPTVTRMLVGYVYAGGYINGHIKRLTYFPTRKSNAELQALST